CFLQQIFKVDKMFQILHIMPDLSDIHFYNSSIEPHFVPESRGCGQPQVDNTKTCPASRR
ncbi:MAG TPA: hypothetical protein O0X70_08215, partial [Methanocorpusculum sp.]|nr:hypothetical protein [Methanocorpusculum sp.]